MSTFCRKARIRLGVCIGAAALLAGWSVAGAAEKAVAQKKDFLHAPPERIQEWRRLKFGLFIHWGPVSIKGTEIGWSRGGERRGHRSGRNPRGIPVEVYDNLYKSFNPTLFDARKWAQTAKSAGMRYMVFTSKHHDGFCMFDTRLSDYKITSPLCPFGRDVVKELSAACRAAGLWWGVYYSPPDWHHPDYRTARHERYIRYLHGQIRELLTRYGRVDVMWFDGLGGSAKDWDAERLFKMIRELQPGILINNRCGLPGDFDTPEQRVGRMQIDRPWETCMTLGTQWAWKPNDRIKSLQECVQTLVRVVGGDGNLLLNVGPMPDGRIEPRQVKRLGEIGRWLERFGESIYDTRGGPFIRARWGASTRRGRTVYVHVLDPKQLPLAVPPLKARILSASVLGGGAARVERSEEGFRLDVPPERRDSIDTIIKLELDRPASELGLVPLRSARAISGFKASASNVFQNQAEAYGPQNAVDGDPSTRWATDAGVRRAWIEARWPKAALISGCRILEAFPGRIRKFELLVSEGKDWQVAAKGGRLPRDGAIRFSPRVADRLRLNILDAADGPTIWEIEPIRAEK